MITLDIRADISEVQTGFYNLGEDIKNINRKILRALTGKARQKVKVNFKRHLNIRSDGLRQHIIANAKTNNFGWVLAAGKFGKQASMLEFGGVLKAKRLKYNRKEKKYDPVNKYLTFKLPSGEWVKKKEVTIPASGFFFDEINAFVDSVQFTATIEATLMREIQKTWNVQ